MSDETKIEDEDTKDVEAHGKLASRVVSANAGEEGDDDVQAHAHRLTS